MPLIKELKDFFFIAYGNAAGKNQDSINCFKKYFLPRVKIITPKLMEEIFMIRQLMTKLSNTTKSEKD